MVHFALLIQGCNGLRANGLSTAGADAPAAYNGTVGLSASAATEAVAETASAEVSAAQVAPAGASEPAETPDAENETMDYLSTLGVGQGLNLTDIAKDDLTPLATDKNGVARPTSGPWNIGPQ